ncbi:MAG: hypothetical protein ABI781_17930 [Burkholderiales bacterium]
MQTTAWMLAGAMALPFTAAIAADGAAPGQPTWARWQGRLSLGSTSTPWRLGADSPVPKFSSASLMGDYYFGRSLASPALLGGFRATTGLMVGPRSMFSAGQPSLTTGNPFSVGSRTFGQAVAPYTSDPAGDAGTATYLGVGYTGLAVRSGWSFSADLGLLAQGAGAAARWGRSLNNSQSLDDAIRQMRMTPLLQLGASYSF